MKNKFKTGWGKVYMPGMILFLMAFFWTTSTDIEVRSISVRDHFGNESEMLLNKYLNTLSQKYPGLTFKPVKISEGLLGEKNTQLYGFQQYLNDIPVSGGELRLKEKNGFVFAAIGKAFPPTSATKKSFELPTKRKLKKWIAQELESKDFQMDEVVPDYLVQNATSPKANLTPSAKIVVTTKTGAKKIFRYANNSITDLGAPAACSHPGEEETVACSYRSGCTEHHGNVANYFHQSVVDYSGGLYKLVDDCDRNITTSYWDNGINYGTNTSNNWCDTRRKRAYSAHWAARLAWDFYEDVMGRNGQFGDGRLLNINLNRCIPQITCNTAWSDPADFSINLGSGGLQYNQVKNIGHEYTHGVLWSSHWNPGWSNLPTSLWNNTEVRSITEGICNIMGSETENFTYEISASASNNTIPANIDQSYAYWFSFDGSGSSSSSYARSLYYEGSNWNHNGSGWNGNTIYDRSFLLCHLFYLLSEGANNYQNPHHPAGGSAPTINLTKLNGGLSRRDATKLMYVSTMTYIHSNWTYDEMAWAMLTTASEWWGICSEQAKRVNTALWAVGLATSATNVDIDFTQNYFVDPMVLRTPNNVTIRNLITSSDFNIEAGNSILKTSVIRTEYNAKVTIKSLVCTLGSGVPNPVGSYNYDEIQARSTEESTASDSPQLSVSPNPFSDRITLSFEDYTRPKEDINLKIFNAQGQLLFANHWERSDSPIEIYPDDLVDWPTGIYYLEVQIEGFKETLKLMKL